MTALAAAVPLRRQPEFLKLWAGQSISVVGDQVSALALPLTAVLTLHASATQMGVLSAAVWAPHLVFSIGAGAWVDRRRHRRSLLIAMDLARAGTLATIPVAYAAGVLSLTQLYAVAFAVGSLTVVFDVANSAFFPLVVPRDQIVDAQAKLSVSRSGSYIVGPALAGLLVQALRAPVAVLADALSFVGSALCLSHIRVVEPELAPASETEPLRRRLAEGFAFLLGQPILRAGVACTSTINFFNLAFNAIVVLYMSRELGLSAGLIGAVLSAGAVGALAGAVAAPRLERRIGIGPAIVAGAVLFPAPLLLFPAARGPQWAVAALLVAGEFLASFGVMIFDVNQNSLWFLLTPYELRARTTGSSRTLTYGVRPLGALAGGALGAALGLRPALWLTGAGALLGVLWLLLSPTLAVRERPAEAA
jgi:MFS family permease